MRLAPRVAPNLARLLATSGALALAILPHVPGFPVWVTLLVAGALLWRIAAEHRGWALPPRWLRLSIALAATLGVLASYRTLNGLAAGTALLALMAGLKLAETRAPRDHAVLVFIGWFLCLAALLAGQSFARLAYCLAVAWLLTAALARVSRPVEANAPARPFRLAARVLALGVPLAVALFLFVPRIEGRFWALPVEEPRATTGIDETMSPGDVASLGLSDAPAFRAWFPGAPPPPEERYWRVLVLEDFDGRTWRRVSNSLDLRAPALERRGAGYDHRIALEPTGRAWLPGLDVVADYPGDVAFRGRSGALVAFDRRLFERRPVTERFVYALRSYPAMRVAADALPRDLEARTLGLPAGRHPGARALAERLRGESADERDYVARVLARFRAENFAYTLEPPPLGADPVDEFLFRTREGFCEHYASAFAVLMRAAGIPARVVTGYQGGEWNAYGGYLLVRQATAHAWVEIWLAGAGWLRVDPTAAVAPDRVSRGSDAVAGRQAAGAPLYARLEWLREFRSAWDAARTAWNESVVGFGPELQRRLLETLGLGDRGWRGLALALTVGFALAALALAAWLAWELRPRRRDPVVVAWERVGATLAARGHPRAPHEGPVAYARRVGRADPGIADTLAALAKAYAALRYLPDATDADRGRFLELARRFRTRLAARPS